MNDDSDLDIAIQQRSAFDSVDTSLLSDVVRATLRRRGVGRAVIGLAVVDDAEIAKLHRQHLGIEGPTDVLTFDLREQGDHPTIEADIVISAETARREAHARGHDERAELALYAVHGLLHLLGFDDHDAEDARLMHIEEDDILSAAGLGRVFGRADEASGGLGRSQGGSHR